MGTGCRLAAAAVVAVLGASLQACSPLGSGGSNQPSQRGTVVTSREYRQIQRGMPFEAVQQIIGDPGELRIQGPGYALVAWVNGDRSFLVVQFLEGRASSWRHKGTLPE